MSMNRRNAIASAAKFQRRMQQAREWLEEASVHNCLDYAVQGADGYECDECGAPLAMRRLRLQAWLNEAAQTVQAVRRGYAPPVQRGRRPQTEQELQLGWSVMATEQPDNFAGGFTPEEYRDQSQRRAQRILG